MHIQALPEHQRNAVDQLIGVALSDNADSRKVASFLLAWWDARESAVSICCPCR